MVLFYGWYDMGVCCVEDGWGCGCYLFLVDFFYFVLLVVIVIDIDVYVVGDFDVLILGRCIVMYRNIKLFIRIMF